VPLKRPSKLRNGDNLPRFEWQHEGLTLAFTPSPKSPKSAANPNSRPIGIIMGEPYVVNADGYSKGCRGKSNKYGILSLPLVVAVDVVSEHCDDIDIDNALFGTETVVANMTPDGPVAESGGRLPDGVWFSKKGARNRTVSAVLIGNKIDRYACALRTPLLVHHPYIPRMALSCPHIRYPNPNLISAHAE
jgi:hypothetical protein